MKFFFDANLPGRVAQALATLDPKAHITSPAERHELRDAEDEVLLGLLEEEGQWVVLTRDRGKKDGDWHMWMASNVTVFFLNRSWSRMKGHEISWRLLKCWAEVERRAKESPWGSKFRVDKHGRITAIRGKKRKK